MIHHRIEKLVLAASLVALSSIFGNSTVQAQKNINFTTTGSVSSTLVFSNQVNPDVYSFFAVAGEAIRLQTSNIGFDTTIRVIGPDASINLFDDDGGGSLASRLQFTAADSGAYIVVVSSFSGNPTTSGNYTLSFARGAAATTLQTSAELGTEQEAGTAEPDVENPIEEKKTP